ncbi:hypothetical protein [Comamonas sp. 17RB]|uniref:hypothetical protein n=1 Tax=Comamonas sp. 17RB TaxID=3047025 RepID=UPI0024B698FC|nr:hypothetical protein [Comamonas sp. 17RB]MDI9854046.1 hypothetical protein [Comamonas sp. 17RB]
MPIFSKLSTPMNRRIGLMGIGSAVAALVSGCSGAQVLDHLVPHDTYHGRTSVSYGPDPRHLLDVYQPATDTVPGNAPLALFLYGGTRRQQRRRSRSQCCRKQFQPHGAQLHWLHAAYQRLRQAEPAADLRRRSPTLNAR